MEICHFFVIFYDFVMKCVYKSTIYTFVIRDKIWTPPFVVEKCTCYFCVLGPENTPTPYMSSTFVLAPPPPPRPDAGRENKLGTGGIFHQGGWKVSQGVEADMGGG